MPGDVDVPKLAEAERISEPARPGRSAATVGARPGRTAATAEAGRTNAAIERAPEWYWRDAWLFSSVMLAGGGSAVNLADVVAATRRSSSPPAFMDRHQIGWAVSRLIGSGLLAEYDLRFAPSPPAIALWTRVTAVGTALSGAELTRSLLAKMRSIELDPAADLSRWRLSADDYMTAVRSGVRRLLVE